MGIEKESNRYSAIQEKIDLQEKELDLGDIDFEKVYQGDVSLPPHMEFELDINSEDAQRFLEKFIDFSKNKSELSARDQEERERFLNFLANIHEAFFASSADPFSKCSLEQTITLGAKATQVPELRGWIGMTSIGEAVYALTFSGKEYFEETKKALEGKSLAETIDMIDYLTSVGAQAIGEMYNNKEALTRTVELIKTLAATNKSAFADYSKDIALTRLERENKNPTIGFLKYHGDRNEGRLNDMVSDSNAPESEKLTSEVKPDVLMVRGDKIMRVAKNAIAIIDHSTMPRFYAFYGEHQQSSGEETSFSDYNQINSDERINPLGQVEADLPILLKQLHQPEMRALIERDLSISLNDLDINSQTHMLRFLAADQKNSNFNRLQSILQSRPEFGQDILISFLACADDLKMGEKIIEIAENLDPESTKAIFSRYSEIVKAIDSIKDYLNENYNQQTSSSRTIESIGQNLLRKDKELLVNFRDNLRDQEKIVQDLDSYKTEILLFAATFKTLRREGQEINLEDFKQYHLDVLSGNAILPENQKEMEKILSINWQSQDPELTSYALSGLYRAFHNPQSRFYIMRLGDQTLGFMRFDDMENDDLYFGSFNINPTIRGAKIGESAMRSYLDLEAATHIIYADSHPDTPITQCYIGKFGFAGVAIKTVPLENGKTRPLIAIVRNNRENENYHYFNDHSRAVNEYQTNEYSLDQPTIILRFNLKEEKNQMLYEVDQILKNGSHVMTAYFDDKEYRYLVFEEKPKVATTASKTQAEAAVA